MRKFFESLNVGVDERCAPAGCDVTAVDGTWQGLPAARSGAGDVNAGNLRSVWYAD